MKEMEDERIYSEVRKQEKTPPPEEVNNDSEKSEIDKIIAQFQQIIDNYETVRKYAKFRGNRGYIVDREIINLYELEQEVTEKHQGKKLYDIISSLQTTLTGIESCKTHILHTLETSLFEQIAKDRQTAPSGKINANIAYGIVTLKERDSNGISDFIERVNTYPLEERCAIITGIAKQYEEENRLLSREAVTMFHNIREEIFKATFSNSPIKNRVKQ